MFFKYICHKFPTFLPIIPFSIPPATHIISHDYLLSRIAAKPFYILFRRSLVSILNYCLVSKILSDCLT